MPLKICQSSARTYPGSIEPGSRSLRENLFCAGSGGGESGHHIAPNYPGQEAHLMDTVTANEETDHAAARRRSSSSAWRTSRASCCCRRPASASPRWSTRRRREAGLPCRSLLGTQIAPEDVSGIPRIVGERSVFCPPRMLLPETAGAVLPVPRRAAGLRAGRAEGVLLAAAGAPARRARAAGRHLGGRGRQPHAGPRAGARDELGAGQPRHHPAPARRRRRMAGLGARATASAPRSAASSPTCPTR